MEYPNPKIKYYKIRTFNEKMNAAFDFLRENWKSLLKFSFYLILPICLLQSFAMNTFYMRFVFPMGYKSATGTIGGLISSFIGSYALLMIILLLGCSVFYSIVYSLMTEYARRDSRLMNIKLKDFKSSLVKNTLKILLATLFFLGFILLLTGLITGLMVLSSPQAAGVIIAIWVLALLGAALLLAIPISLFVPIYIFEDISFFKAFRKSFKYGFSAWGQTFLLLFVFGLLANIISGVTTMPWYVVMLIGQIFSVTEQGAGINIGYQFVMYLLGIIQSYGTYVSLIISAVGMAFQYFHLREKNEGISVYTNIQNFDRL